MNKALAAVGLWEGSKRRDLSERCIITNQVLTFASRLVPRLLSHGFAKQRENFVPLLQ